MALLFDLRVNNEKIGYFEAVRKSGGSDPADVNRYDVNISEPVGAGTRTHAFTVEHRYGDGAWELVRAALEKHLTPTGPGDLVFGWGDI